MIASRIKKLFIVFAFLLPLAFAANAFSKPADGLWVEFAVPQGRFHAVVTQPEAIDYILNYAAGLVPPRSLEGQVEDGGAFNAPWHWHLDPQSVHFARGEFQSCARSNSNDPVHCIAAAHIVKVEDCRGGSCHPLQGVYGGRTPF